MRYLHRKRYTDWFSTYYEIRIANTHTCTKNAFFKQHWSVISRQPREVRLGTLEPLKSSSSVLEVKSLTHTSSVVSLSLLLLLSQGKFAFELVLSSITQQARIPILVLKQPYVSCTAVLKTCEESSSLSSGNYRICVRHDITATFVHKFNICGTCTCIMVFYVGMTNKENKSPTSLWPFPFPFLKSSYEAPQTILDPPHSLRFQNQFSFWKQQGNTDNYLSADSGLTSCSLRVLRPQIQSPLSVPPNASCSLSRS